MVQSGSADNVIPDTAFCKGTVRTFDTEVQAHVMHKMDKLLQGLAVANDITYDFDYIKGYLPVHNNPKCFDIVKQASNEMNLRFNESELMMIGEDFSHYQKVRPGAFLLTGCGNPAKDTTHPHHSSYFNLDEKALKYSASQFLKILELENVIKP